MTPGEQNPPAISVTGLRKNFGAVVALDGVDLTVPDGSFFALLGPSGAGKTTTLRVIAGLERPDAGTVRLGRLDATAATPAARDLAMVFQSYALYPKQTARQNIASPLRARRLPPARIAEAVDRVSDLLHIERLLDRRPAQLSGGEQQRVALGRALVREPRAFLMDEPLTNLDLKLRVEMRAELTRIHRALGRTFLYVTNDHVEAMSMADRVAVLRDGRIEQAGTPMEIYQRPATRWVAGFVGSPQINVLPGRFAAGTGRPGRLAGDGGWRLPAPSWCPKVPDGSPVLVGIRAEDLTLAPTADQPCLEGEVYVVEPLGDRTLVDVRVGEAVVRVKARPGFTLPAASDQAGPRLRIGVHLDRIHLFDATTERALRP
ncbi:carbohydrate ABC transporter ATP-binding protein%2C CUT1 family [Mycobacterium tuberculosis]|nr:carbohydrate ABC transporter ATP-binding protein%2C CUT1 family [Mycobacterium tuberculosis]